MPSANEDLRDETVKNALSVLRVSSGTREKTFALLNELEDELVGMTSGAGPLTPSARRRLEDLLASVQVRTARKIGQARQIVTSDMADLGDIVTQRTLRNLNGAIGADLGSITITKGDFAALTNTAVIQGRPLASFWEGIAPDLSLRYEKAIRTSIALGETNDQMIAKIAGRRGEKAILQTSERMTETLVRTSFMSVNNHVMLETIAQNADLVKALKHHSTLDSRTSLICQARSGKRYKLKDGKVEPIGHSLPFLNGAPYHPNALAAGAMITTERGQVPIERVRVGDRVLTGRGRWRRVTHTAEREELGSVYVIHDEIGRQLRATNEHPILTKGGWRLAREIKPGDELIADEKQLPYPESFPRVDRATDDCPAFSDADGILRDIALTTGCVPAAIKLNTEHGRGNGEVKEAVSGNALVDEPRIDNRREEEFLGSRDVSSVAASVPDHHGVNMGNGWVGAFHALGRGEGMRVDVFRLTEPVVVGAESFGKVLHGQARGGPLAPSFDACALASSHKRGFPEPVTALNLAQGEAMIVMQIADRQREPFGRSEIVTHWRSIRIVEVERKPYRGKVYDLTVEDDATYVADGVVVHNCRSIIIPVLLSFEELAKSGKKFGGKGFETAFREALEEQGFGADEIADIRARTQASMDGQVPRSLTFEDFALGKGSDFLDDVLGPGRAKLFTDGKISFGDLLNNSGGIRTIDELKQVAIQREIAEAATRARKAARKKAPARMTPEEFKAEVIEERARQMARGSMARVEDKKKARVLALLTPDEMDAMEARIKELRAAPAAPTMADMLALDAKRSIPRRRVPLSSAIKIKGLGEAEDEARQALRAMDAVMDGTGLPEIRAVFAKTGSSYDSGEYVFKGLGAVEIRLRKDAPRPGFTLTHETGHLIDHQALGTQGNGFASQEGMLGLLGDALATSRPVKQLARDLSSSSGTVKAHLRYLSDDREIFARAFSQYVATRSGFQSLRAQFDSDRQGLFGGVMYWTPDEFEPIARIFDELFR